MPPDVPLPRPHGSTRAHAAALLLIVALGAGLRWPGVDRPFGHPVEGWTGAFYAAIARNQLALGTWVPIANPLPAAGENVAYAHHPPLVPWCVAASFAWLGPSELAARLPFLLASLGAIVLIHRLMRRVAGTSAGLIAALLLATCPVAVHFGHQVEVVGSLLLFGLLGTSIAHLDHQRAPSPRTTARLVAWWTVSFLADWPAVILFVVLQLRAFVRGAVPRRRVVLETALGLLVLFAIVAAMVSVAPGDGWQLLARKIHQRSVRLVSDQGQSLGLARTGFRALRTHWNLIGPAMMAGAAWWLVARSRRATEEREVVGVALMFGVAFCVVGAQGHHQHDYWLHPVALAYVLPTAACLAALPRRRFARAAAVLATVGVHLVFAHAYRERGGDPAADDHRRLAGWVAALVPEDEVVAVLDTTDWPTLPYYLPRRQIGIADPAELDALREAPRHEPLPWEARPTTAPVRWFLSRRPVSATAALELREARAGWHPYRLAAQADDSPRGSRAP